MIVDFHNINPDFKLHEGNRIIWIEVKATSDKEKFFLSATQFNLAMKMKENFHLYRVEGYPSHPNIIIVENLWKEIESGAVTVEEKLIMKVADKNKFNSIKG